MLLGDLRISSPLPASAELNLYGLPVEKTARDYIWGHRIGGPTTMVFGSRTKINPDIVQVVLHPYLMSHQFRDTNGSLEMRPAFQSAHPQALMLSSDAIERRATGWLARESSDSERQFQLVTSVRQSDVVAPLKDAVPELRAIPRYTDSQTYLRLRSGDQTLEGFLLFGRERGDWRETHNGLDGVVVQNTRQNLAILRYEQLLPHQSKLTAGVSWEGDHVVSDYRYGQFNQQTNATSHMINPRIAYSTRREACTVWISQFNVESEPGSSVWQSSVEGGVESRATLGWFTVQPSLAVQQFRDEATFLHGVTATVHPDQVTLMAGYSTYADYFVFKDGIFGNVFEPGYAQRPQTALHYVASIQYEPKRRRFFDLVRLAAVRKDLDVDLPNRTDVRILSWDFIVARSGRVSWEVAALNNDARQSTGPMVGSIPFSMRAGISGDLFRSFNVSIEANYRSGSIAENRAPGPRYQERFKLNPSHYVNAALTQRFMVLNRPAHVTVTVFNALALAGGRAELTVDENGRRYDAPCWANIRFRYDLW